MCRMSICGFKRGAKIRKILIMIILYGLIRKKSTLKQESFFLDTEESNWTWDEVAQKYYWHRFFSHQPDLNYDNPAVEEELMKVMDYWLGLGIDGFRVDAVPYLIEREGTNCENLPETHAILKRMRRFTDDNYPDCMMMCEANQWPEDVREYFGEGDEFHMGFNFPLMPRIYQAVAQHDAHSDSKDYAIFARDSGGLSVD